MIGVLHDSGHLCERIPPSREVELIRFIRKLCDAIPDRDTAYRYWGDALMKAGKPDEARVKFEQAFVAELYSRPGWLSLLQWARLTKTPVAVPQIAPPKFTDSEGALVPDTALATEAAKSSGRAAWMAYETCRVMVTCVSEQAVFWVTAANTRRTGEGYAISKCGVEAGDRE